MLINAVTKSYSCCTNDYLTIITLLSKENEENYAGWLSTISNSKNK